LAAVKPFTVQVSSQSYHAIKMVTDIFYHYKVTSVNSVTKIELLKIIQ